jgi:hypothetical protein
MRKQRAIAVIIIVAVPLLVWALAALTAPLQIIGSYAIPSSGASEFPTDLPGARVALRTFDIPHNYYEFDCATLQFVNPQYFDHPDIENDVLGWVCWAGSAANLGLDFGDWEHAGIGSRSTGQLLYEFPLDDEMPYMYAGMADSIEVMIVISEYHGKTHFLDLSQPGFLGTISWPDTYRTPEQWASVFADDYANYHALNSYCYNSLSQTLFIPVSHQGLVYWSQIDLSGGFDYTMGIISCGTSPQFIIQSADETAVYVFDDAANQVFTISPFSKQVTNSARFESGSVLGKTIYHQGCLFFSLEILPSGQLIQRMVRLDPASGSVSSITLPGFVVMDLDAYGSSIYALQHDEEDNCHLLEMRSSDLDVLDDIVVGDEDTIRMLVDTPSGRLVVDDATNRKLLVVQL